MGLSLRIYMGILNGNDGFCPLFLQKDLVSYIHEIDSKSYGLQTIDQAIFIGRDEERFPQIDLQAGIY